jgi:ComF family protein
MTRALVDLMAQALPTQLDVDLLMPVPLHPSRLRAREFNQSLLLADGLGRQLNCQVSPSNLVRISATEPQTTLSRPARLRNLRKAFDLRNAEEVAGRRILLVDDVYTTGTTVNECAKVLKRSGVESVMILTLARTVDASLIPDRHVAESSDPIMTLVGP